MKKFFNLTKIAFAILMLCLCVSSCASAETKRKRKIKQKLEKIGEAAEETAEKVKKNLTKEQSNVEEVNQSQIDEVSNLEDTAQSSQISSAENVQAISAQSGNAESALNQSNEANTAEQPTEGIKADINLMSLKKAARYGQGGRSNCLKICAKILRNHKQKTYGSGSNVYKLMYETKDGLKLYGDNPAQNYANAIACIDRHLEADKVIIVGINHTIKKRRAANEGTTDHFVVIGGREYDAQTKQYSYLYYEVGAKDEAEAADSQKNRLVYDPQTPSFFDASDRLGRRIDVIQIRPNDGNLKGTIAQDAR